VERLSTFLTVGADSIHSFRKEIDTQNLLFIWQDAEHSKQNRPLLRSEGYGGVR
jgi:hypothetical protein